MNAPTPAPAPTYDFTGLTLRTERLILRPWVEADIDAITAACQDPLIARYTVVPSPYARADSEKFVREIAPGERAAGTGAIFGVFAAGTGELAASVGLHNLRHLDTAYGGDGGIGYWAAPGTRGRGYTTEAVREVCRWAVEDLRTGEGQCLCWHAATRNSQASEPLSDPRQLENAHVVGVQRLRADDHCLDERPRMRN